MKADFLVVTGESAEWNSGNDGRPGGVSENPGAARAMSMVPFVVDPMCTR